MRLPSCVTDGSMTSHLAPSFDESRVVQGDKGKAGPSNDDGEGVAEEEEEHDGGDHEGRPRLEQGEVASSNAFLIQWRKSLPEWGQQTSGYPSPVFTPANGRHIGQSGKGLCPAHFLKSTIQ